MWERWKGLGCESLLVHNATLAPESKWQGQYKDTLTTNSGVRPAEKLEVAAGTPSAPHFLGVALPQHPTSPSQPEAGVSQGGGCPQSQPSGGF